MARLETYLLVFQLLITGVVFIITGAMVVILANTDLTISEFMLVVWSLVGYQWLINVWIEDNKPRLPTVKELLLVVFYLVGSVVYSYRLLDNWVR